MTFILVASLSALLGISFYVFDRKITSPSFLFIFGFLFSSVIAFIYRDLIGLDLHLNTFLLYIGGGLSFLLGACISKKIYQNYIRKSMQDLSRPQQRPIKIKRWIIVVWCVFAGVVLYMYYDCIIKNYGGNWLSIGSSLYVFRNRTFFSGEQSMIPKVIDYGVSLVKCCSYIWAYIFINNVIIEKKVDFYLILPLFLSALSLVSDGSRGGVLNLVIYSLILFLILSGKEESKKKLTIVFKIIICILCVVLMGPIILKKSAQTLGRSDSSDINSVEYFVMYTGAPVKNLDSFMSMQNKKESDTLIFREYNGVNLGNVSSMYSFLVVKYGLWLFLILFFLSGALQLLYELGNIRRPGMINVYLIIYGFAAAGAFFSFFGNMLLDSIFSPSFIAYLACWAVISIIINTKAMHV